MADTLAGALSPAQKRAIGAYLSPLFGSARFRILEVDPANDPMVMIEIVWPFDHGRNYRGVRVGIPRSVVDGVQKGCPLLPQLAGAGGNVKNKVGVAHGS